MATVSVRLVQDEIRKLCAVSDGLKKRFREIMERLEQTPDSFPVLEEVPADLLRPGVQFVKVKVVNRSHDFRIVFLYRQSEEHLDALYVFSRKSGYQIDWKWVRSLLDA